MKLVIALVALVGIGVAVAMFLSARTTEQAFILQKSHQQSESLGNELESLNRDYKELSSSEHLASEAARLGMVVPGQTGVLEVQGGHDGQGDQVNEVRPADGTKDTAIVDLNANRQNVPRANRPTTDPVTNAGVPSAQSTVPSDRGAGAPAAAPAPGNGQSASPTGQLPYTAQAATPAG